MGRRLERRIDDLEQRADGPGRTIVCYRNDWRTGDDAGLSEADARAQMQPGDTLFVLEYVRDWRSSAEPD